MPEGKKVPGPLEQTILVVDPEPVRVQSVHVAEELDVRYAG